MPETLPTRRIPTRGHELFEAWLSARYGRSLRTGRPSFGGMRLFVHDLNEAVRRADPEQRPLAQAITVYEWLATAHGPKKPREAYRRAIEQMSRGKVVVGAWDESAPGAVAA